MKNSNTNLIRIAAVAVLCLLPLAPRSMAATSHPLSYPYGLAVDAKGNLYVANSNGNQVLVYSPAHVQLTGKTITKNVSTPNAVAFDLDGNLWVGNGGTASITEYSPSGVQNVNGTISSGLTQPNTIAFDGLDNLWVQDAFATLLMYPQLGNQPLVTIPTGSAITGLASHQGLFEVGSNFGTFVVQTSSTIQNNPVNITTITQTCYAMAWSTTNKLYCGNEDESLVVMDTAFKITTLAQLGFFPTGLAVDSVRGLIYVANGSGNEIAVYSTTGSLLATIK